VQRARKIELFSRSRFFVAEEFTRHPGGIRADRRDDQVFDEIIEGKHDEVPESASS